MIKTKQIAKHLGARAGINIWKEIKVINLENLTPRITLCVVRKTDDSFQYGISLRNQKDNYNRTIGTTLAFIRACRALIREHKEIFYPIQIHYWGYWDFKIYHSIIKTKGERSEINLQKAKLKIDFVKLRPRSILCILHNKNNGKVFYGIATKNPKDVFKSNIGKKLSLVRACNSMIKYYKAQQNQSPFLFTIPK